MDKVVHFEVPFDDKEKCVEFYKNVFGWEFQDMPEMNYVMARSCEVDDKFMPKESGAINGGMYKRDGKTSKNPVIVIDVKSVDESLSKIQESGGKVVMEKVKVGDMGYYAQFEDCEGNVLGVWENVKKEE